MYVNDPKFGKIIDYDNLRDKIKETVDFVYPDFNMVGAVAHGAKVFNDDANLMVMGGASLLAYSMLIAAEEHELAASLKDKIFTLGWTEEHAGTDLLSVTTQATPISDDPDEREFHVKGRKWLINNSYHADYHMIVAKIDPEKDGPRSLSIFIVPQSSCKNWERLETHVLQNMVLTTFEIDGPGRLVGKRGHGLTILQRMAMPSKYQASYAGITMLKKSIPAAIEHLSTKRIFGENPIDFSNVFRQLYNIVMQTALLNFIYFRSVAFADSSFLQFYGTMLKSWLLLRVNEVLSQNLLVTGSKGFLAESTIGRDAFDSFVLPVFDGHYTLNTLMTAKHARRFLNAERIQDVSERMELLRENLYVFKAGNQMDANTMKIRKPDFFNYAAYIHAMDIPIEVNAKAIVSNLNALLDEIDERGLSGDPEHKYKTGTLLHWADSVTAACEMWAFFQDDRYLNAIVQQYNAFTKAYNEIVSEGGFTAPFMTPMRHLPLPEIDDPRQFLYDLLDMETKVNKMRQAETVGTD